MEPNLEPLDHEAIRPNAAPRRAKRRKPDCLLNLLQLRHEMSMVTTKFMKTVNYSVVDVQMTLRSMEEQLNKTEEKHVIQDQIVITRDRIATTRDQNQTTRFYNQMTFGLLMTIRSLVVTIRSLMITI